MNDNKNSLKLIMSDIFDIDYHSVDDEVSTKSVEAWDSIKHLSLVISIEESFDISFSVMDISEATSFTKICELLNKKGIHL